MAQFLVRDLPDQVVTALKERAARHGRSPEAELRALIQETLSPQGMSWIEQADQLRIMTRGRSLVPSWILIREDRDSH